jgi:hypothetical protein
LAKSLETGWSQWVVATPGQSLLVGAQEADFVSWRQYQSKQKPCLGSDGTLPYGLLLEEKYFQINSLEGVASTG